MVINILLGIFLLLSVFFYMFRTRMLEKRLAERERMLHEVEETTEVLCQNVHAYILLVDKDFIVRRTNYYHLTNQVDDKSLKRVGELLRCKNGLDAGHCGEHELCKICPVRQAISKSFREKNEFIDVEASMRLYISDKKDEYVDCEITASGKYINLNGKEGMLLTVYDISKLKKTQEELIAAKERAEESDKLKSAFLANMSHEIRTPLNAIVGFAPLLANVTSPEEKESFLEIIRSNSELLLQLINDILDLSKIEAGTLEFIYSDVDLYSMVKDLEGVFRMRLSKDNSEVEIHLENQPALEVIHTERNRVSQVLSNFLSNAIKFTEAGSITLGYKIRENDIYFYVTDTGTGIAEDHLGSVFKRFTKLDVRKKGTGLGLAISKMIIEKLDGEIGVESAVGKGSTFWFTLPVKPLDTTKLKDSGMIDVSSMENSGAEKSSMVRLKTLLIAEDMEDNYLLYEAFLGKKYNLVHAWNGEEAIALFLKKTPDAVIMDLRMPVVDGYQATEAIRQISPTVPILAATAFAFEEDKRKVMASGFTGYISKPIKADALYSKMKEIGI